MSEVTDEPAQKPICIYHGNCVDGFGAAWAIWWAYGDAYEYYGGRYGVDPPDVTGRDVLLVDFSYKREPMFEILEQASSVTILDHHKTAVEEIGDLVEDGTIAGELDMERSGAMMAWEWAHPGTEPPRLLYHIQDRDLWRFALADTAEIQAALFSYPYDFELWTELMQRKVTELADEGEAITRKHNKDIDELLKACQRRMEIGGVEVPVANLPHTMASDAGHRMAQGERFAACYWDTPEGRTFSLRSAEDGWDVSEIAKDYGGGGHKHAAGFRVSHADAQRFEIRG